MKVNSEMSPVQHSPRRVPVVVRARLKEELDRMTEQEIIAPVTAPTPWVSSMVVLPKPKGKFRIYLDPKELNKAIQREHYPLPTIEDVATRLHGANTFTKLQSWTKRVENLLKQGLLYPLRLQYRTLAATPFPPQPILIKPGFTSFVLSSNINQGG